MGTFGSKTALVSGGTSGVGRETVKLLLAEGATVATIARRQEGLDALQREVSGEVRTFAGDIADPSLAGKLVRGLAPALIVLCAGAHPKLAPVHEHTWESFSEPWNVDVK